MGIPAIRRYEGIPGEHPRVTAMRVQIAAEERAFMLRYAGDPDVSDLDLTYTLHMISYERIRDMVALALKLTDTREDRSR